MCETPDPFVDLHDKWDGIRPRYALRSQVLEKPGNVLRWTDVRNVDFYLEFLAWTEEEVHSTLTREQRIPRAILVTRLAGLLGAPCLMVRAYCLLMAAHALDGLYDKAEQIRIAAERVCEETDCRLCRSAVLRETTRLKLYKGETGDAVEVASTAIELARGHHDYGRALVVRAIAHRHDGAYDLASRDYGKALKVLPVRKGSGFRSAAIINMAVALAASGKRAALEEAKAMLPDIRRAYKKKRGVSSERARLQWLEGDVCAGTGYVIEAEGFFDRSQTNFAALGLAHELAGVIAHQAALKYPDRHVVRAHMASILACKPLLDCLDEEIVERIEAVRDATRRGVRWELHGASIESGDLVSALDWDSTGEIAKALGALLEGMEESHRVIPCLFDLRPNVLPYSRPGRRGRIPRIVFRVDDSDDQLTDWEYFRPHSGTGSDGEHFRPHDEIELQHGLIS